MSLRVLIPFGLLAIAVAGWLAACSELPRPFQGAANPLARPDETIDIAVEPLTGVPAPLARHVAAAVSYHLSEIDIPATDSPGMAARYRLKGVVEPMADSQAAPQAAIIHWTLLDAEGSPVGIHDQDVSGTRADWERGEPYLIGRVGAAAALALAQVVNDAESGVAPPPADSLLVETVQGAPGDGNRSLTQAIRKALVGNGFVVVENGRPAAYRLIGEVAVAPPQGGRQSTRIVWRVVAIDGTESGRAVGRAAQENLVPAGSLDGVWGEAATAVAEAAIPGIGEVLKRDRPAAEGAALGR